MPPAGLFDLSGLGNDLAGDIACVKAQHERVRKGPVLAAEVFQVTDLDIDLLHDLPTQRFHGRLAGLDEPGQGTEEAGSEVRRTGQQHLLAPGDENDDAWRQLGILPVAAATALHGPLVIADRRGLTAPAAVTVGLIPDIERSEERRVGKEERARA